MARDVAGRAGFVLELDKTQLDTGLPQAERQFNRATTEMARSATQAGTSVSRSFDGLLTSVRGMRREAEDLERTIGTSRPGGSGLGGSLASMGSLLGRGGLIGIGANAAFQAMNQLQRSLETTGAAAYTTEGRLKNVGAALLNTDVIGAFKAWERQPKTIEELGLALDGTNNKLAEATHHLREIKDIAFGESVQAYNDAVEKFGKDSKQAGDALEHLNQVSDVAGVHNRKLAEEVLGAARSYVELGRQARAALNQVLSFRSAEGQAITRGIFSGLRPAPAPQASLGQRLRAAGFVPDTSKQSDNGVTGGATRLQNLQLDLADAQRRDDLADQKRIQESIVAIYQARVNNTKLTGQALVRFKQELSRELDVLDGIEDSIDAEQQRREDEQARKRAQRAADMARKREDAAREAARKQAEYDRNAAAANKALPGYGPYARTSRGFVSEGMSWQDAARKAKKAKEEDTFTLADLRRMQFEFLQSLNGITNQFGSNVTLDSGQTATNTWRTSKLTEQVVAGMDRLARATAHPGAKYARNALTEATGDAGSV